MFGLQREELKRRKGVGLHFTDMSKKEEEANGTKKGESKEWRNENRS